MNKKIFSLIFLLYFFISQSAFALEGLPSSSQELENFFFDFLREFPIYFSKSLGQFLEIVKKTWHWFDVHFFQKIYLSVKKEFKQRKPIIKKEFEQEKTQTKIEFKEWLSSIINRIQTELKKK